MASVMFHLTLLSCGIMLALSDLMRAERDADIELHLGAAGELHRVDKERHRPDQKNGQEFGENVGANDFLKDQAQGKASEKQNDMCDLDFPLGKVDEDKCKGNDRQILDRAQCHEAARQHKDDDKKSFLLDSNWFDVHPEGCFEAVCVGEKVDATERADFNASLLEGEMCFFFNPTGSPPTGPITGTPVCERPKFVNATKPDINVEGCDAGYKRIYDEDLCHKVGGCLSDPDAAEFRVGIKNFSQHFDYPRGCFIAEDGEVYYNPIVDITGTSIAIKTDAVVHGMPLCQVDEGAKGNETVNEGNETVNETR